MRPARGDVTLRADQIFVESPLKPGLDWPEELSRYSRVDNGGSTLVRLPVRFLKINETSIWAAPVELFSEIAIEHQKQIAVPAYVLLRLHEWLVRLSADSGGIRRRRLRTDYVTCSRRPRSSDLTAKSSPSCKE